MAATSSSGPDAAQAETAPSSIMVMASAKFSTGTEAGTSPASIPSRR
jgi:hypothetical protein